MGPRRKASIGSRRAGAIGLATHSPRSSLRIQKKEKKRTNRRSPPSADDELQELLQVEEGELQEEAAEEEEPQGVGELTRFDGSAPKPFPASRNGPTDKEWTRVDLIVDSGASDSTLFCLVSQ